ncbi:hypothetical protein FRC02_007224 [Tulasnella sp. 418]|nr:hypothetical protein FRC02_007224 [Tulasnella sp. 418]
MSPQNCGPNGDPLVNQQYCAKQSHDNHLHIRDIFSSDYRGNPILPNPTVFPTPPIRYNSMASVPTPVFHKITLVDRESLYRVAVTLFLGSALYLCLRSFYLWLDADVRLLPSPIFERPHWLWGHEMITFINSAGKKYTEWFNTLGPVFRIRGALFHGDIIVTADPAMVNHILIKNVYDYEKSPMIRPVAERLVGRGLVWAEGDDHKRQRKLLNPAFTNEHIRNMAPDVTECTERYIAALEAHLLNQPTKETEVDMQEWNAKVTLDIIGRTGFGFDFGLGSSPEAQHILKGWHNQATQGFSKTTMMVCHADRCIARPRL